jgi:signal peptidase II
LWAYGYLFAIAGAIILLDQWTKSIVRENLAVGERWTLWPWLMPYARIVNWQNTGAAFGILQQFGGIFTLLAIIVSVAIILYFPRVPSSEWPLRLALGLQLGGAIGNLVDRLAQGHVTDFIGFFNFAVFNVADASISIGVVVLIVGVWYRDRKLRLPSGEASPGLSGESPAGNTAGNTTENRAGNLPRNSPN